MIRILIIDDQNSVLHSLEGLIESEEKLKVVGMAKNGQQGIKLVEQLRPDVAIIDLTMPLKDGIETTCLIYRHYPQTKVLILTGSDGRMLNQAISAGASGYLLKNSSREDLIAAIEAVKRNNVYIGEGILDRDRLLSIDSQQTKLKQINSWLAKEAIDWWCKHSLCSTPTAKQIVESLSLDRSGLSWMKERLCRRENKHFTLIEEIELRIEQLFVEIENSTEPERELIARKTQIFDWLKDEKNTDSYVDCLAILHGNFQSLQITTSSRLQKVISSLWQEVAPLPLLECLRSVKKYLLNWHQFFKQERDRRLVKENAAWHSFDYLLESQDNLNKQELCKKAVIFIYRCRINAELNNLLAQIVSQILQQLETQIGVVEKTNNLLLESKKQLEQQYSPELLALTPFFEQLQQKDRLKLRRDMEKSIGHSLNQWGVCQSISNSKINDLLIEKLRPIAREIYTDLRQEALAVSFLEYAPLGKRKLITED